MGKVIKIFFSVSLIISVISLQMGCSMFRSGRQRFSVTTSEPDAQIFVNGELLGVGNVTTSVPRNESVAVLAKKEG